MVEDVQECCRTMRAGPGSAQNASRTERLLLEREEHGVYELDVLEVIVDHVVKFEPLYGH